MAVKVLTFVIDTAEQDLDSVLAAAINEIHSLGHTVKQVRLTDDSGEQLVPTNMIAGVTVHEPVSGGSTTEPAPAAPASSEHEVVGGPAAPGGPAFVEPTPPTEAVIPDPNAPADVPVDEPPDPSEVTTTTTTN